MIRLIFDALVLVAGFVAGYQVGSVDLLSVLTGGLL